MFFAGKIICQLSNYSCQFFQRELVFVAMNKLIENNVKPIALSIGGFLLVCIIAAAVFEIRSQRQAKALTALWEAKRKSEQLIGEKKLSEAKAVLEEIAAKYKGTSAAYDANLSIGDINSQEKDYAGAAKSYQGAADSAPDKFSKMLATYNRGTAEEQGGNCQAAVQIYEEAIKLSAGDYLSPELMMAEARCYETLGDKAKAAALYKDVHDKFANKTYYSATAAANQQRLQAETVKN